MFSLVLAAAVAVESAPALPRNSVAGTLSPIARIDQEGSGLLLTLQGERFILPFLTIGAFIDRTVFTSDAGEVSYYSRFGVFDFTALGPMVGLHAVAKDWLDLYARFGGGLAIVQASAGGRHLRETAIYSLEGRAELGADFRFGAFLIGPAVTALTFHARNGQEIGLGIRAGAAW